MTKTPPLHAPGHGESEETAPKSQKSDRSSKISWGEEAYFCDMCEVGRGGARLPPRETWEVGGEGRVGACHVTHLSAPRAFLPPASHIWGAWFLPGDFSASHLCNASMTRPSSSRRGEAEAGSATEPVWRAGKVLRTFPSSGGSPGIGSAVPGGQVSWHRTFWRAIWHRVPEP